MDLIKCINQTNFPTKRHKNNAFINEGPSQKSEGSFLLDKLTNKYWI